MDPSLVDIDDQLSKAVKARESATKMIRNWSAKVVEHTKTIDRLLQERSDIVLSTLTCPDTAAVLMDDSPARKGA